MEIQPIKQKMYRKPRYPNRQEIDLDRLLLECKPKRWQKTPIVAVALSAVMILSLTGCDTEIGNGFRTLGIGGSVPTKMMLSEEDAFMVISSEFRNIGYEVEKGGGTVPDVQLFKKTNKRKKLKKMPMELDFTVKGKKIKMEFISEIDVRTIYFNNEIYNQNSWSAEVLAAKSRQSAVGIAFFGGEPLLRKQLIYDVVEYTHQKEDNKKYFFKITTNGLLLDDAFIEYACKKNIYIALSMDGIAEAHDRHRITANGQPTHQAVEKAAKLLLKARPYSPVLMTINPDTVPYYADSVEYLYELGFRYLICTLNYSADWDKASLNKLKKQYQKMAGFYYRHTMAENKFYLSPFDVKISSHIQGENYCHERCELGRNQVSVSCDGGIYPCIQFVGEEKYRIGDVVNGINTEKQLVLFAENENEKQSCKDCAVKQRCNHYCACLNKQTTGEIGLVSPIVCAHERTILPIADQVAERLYKKRNGLFIQKHYNDFYSLISLTEDKVGSKSRVD